MPLKQFILAALVFACAAAVSASAQASSREAAFDFVWKTIEARYYDAAFNGADWNAVRERYRPLALSAASETEFFAVLDRMAGELRDSHTRVYAPGARGAARGATGVGARLVAIDGRFVVKSVAKGSGAEAAGITPGDVVVAIDGRAAADVAIDVRKRVGVSSSAVATDLRVASNLLRGAPESVVRLRLATAAGEREVAVARSAGESESGVTAKLIAPGVAYVAFRMFDARFEKEIAAAVKRFRRVESMIVDLRGNPGGDGEVGLRFASLFAARTRLAEVRTRTGKPVVPGMPPFLETPAKKVVFSGRLVFLVDEGTASSSELYAASLQEAGRAAVVGSRTCGCVLAFLDYVAIPGGGELTVSEMDFRTAKGTRIEGRGVMPDVIAAPTAESLRAGRDPALEAALARLSAKSK